MMTAPVPMGRLPAILTGRRRRFFLAVIITGVVQSAAAAGAALLAPRILAAPTASQRYTVAAALVAAAVLVGLARWGERVWSERLAQDYVHQLRLELVTAALSGRGNSSIGVTVARTTNDLTAVRSWIILGIVPFVTGVPLVIGVVIGLALLHPALAVAGLLPVALLGIGIVALAPAAYRRARELRRRRGRMASRLADTVGAGETIRRSGGIDREVTKLSARSTEVVDAAVSRIVVTGGMRGLATGLAAFAAVAVAVVGAIAGVEVAAIASGFMLVGMLTAPLSDLGRVGEFRQGFLAAERIIAPLLEQARTHREEERRRTEELHTRGRAPSASCPPPGVVHIADLDLGGGSIEILANPGERITVNSADPQRVRQFVSVLLGDPGAPGAWINIAGHRLTDLPARERRLLVGHAGADTTLEPGTLARAVRYRVPAGEEEVVEQLRRVGLADRVAELPRGERTRIAAGGAPLDNSERARVHVARALYGGPPLVVLDGVDNALGAGGRAMLRERLATYPGVVVIVSEDPDSIVPGARRVDLDEGRAVQCSG